MLDTSQNESTYMRERASNSPNLVVDTGVGGRYELGADKPVSVQGLPKKLPLAGKDLKQKDNLKSPKDLLISPKTVTSKDSKV